MDEQPGFHVDLRHRLRAYGVIGDPGARADCARMALALGEAALREAEALAGARVLRRAFTAARGPDHRDNYRYVAGYGELMTLFLSAPVGLPPEARAQVARLGGLANLLVSYFDELVDGGWPRAKLLPRWALAIAPLRAGRTLVGLLARIGPAPGRLSRRLVVEYFRRVTGLPHAGRHAAVRKDLRRMIGKMYLEEGRTPDEWRRLRGDPARQQKTALPLAVLGLPAWLASADCPPGRYARHRRWLFKLGLFIRWIDDAADLALDARNGSANLVRRALAGHAEGRRPEDLADRIARRGRWLLEEWRDQMAPATPAPEPGGVLSASLVAWLGAPE